MPTFETLPRFEKDWKNLTPQQQGTLRKVSSNARPGPPLAACAGSRPVTVGSIRVRYRLMRGLLRSRQPAAGTAIRAREPAAAAGWT